jgi:hypothetical protein
MDMELPLPGENSPLELFVAGGAHHRTGEPLLGRALKGLPILACRSRARLDCAGDGGLMGRAEAIAAGTSFREQNPMQTRAHVPIRIGT